MNRKLLATLSVMIVASALSFCLIRFEQPIAQVLHRWHNWHPFESGVEIGGLIPVILYTNIGSVSPFIAVVESKSFEKATTANEKEGSSPASLGIAWMSIRLKKEDGSHLAIVWENPDSNMVAFGNSLQNGASYEFPSVINKWNKNRQ